jgi:mRNA-degrading endonuclease RelE of RelBE toxin-antitoxin system
MTKSAPPIRVEWTSRAIDALKKVGSASVRKRIYQKVQALLTSERPEQIGKPLQGDLSGLYRITHGRYRIVYDVRRVRRGGKTVLLVRVRILHVGIRKAGDKADVYAQLAKLLREIMR